jgi:hypothetical protein
MSSRILLVAALLLAATLTVRPAAAEPQAATVASVTGTVEVQRSGAGDWQPAIVGTVVFVLDGIRTGPGSAAKLLFSDDAVIDLAPSTELTVERYGAQQRGKGPRRALLKLAGGKIEAFVSGYGDENARFEIETPTAVARVQSTEFIVQYNAAEKATDVVGVDGVVALQGRTGLIGPGVAVGPSEASRVQEGGFPSPVHAVDAAQRAQILAGLRVVGSGVREGLDIDNPIAAGRLVGPEDRPQMAAAGHGAAGALLKPVVPGEKLIDRLSPDVRANTQPLPVYRAVPPNQSPNPAH